MTAFVGAAFHDVRIWARADVAGAAAPGRGKAEAPVRPPRVSFQVQDSIRLGIALLNLLNQQFMRASQGGE